MWPSDPGMSLWDLARAAFSDDLWGASLAEAAAPLAGDLFGDAGTVTCAWAQETFDAVTSASGLGHDVDELMARSPTLAANVAELREDGVAVIYGEPGEGSFFDPARRIIVVDPIERGDPASLVQTLAHESGHALYERDPAVRMAGHSRDDYVEGNVERALKDEGEATITNLVVRDEILKATRGDADGKVDIGVAGAKARMYLRLFKTYPDPDDRDLLREKIGDVYARGEEPNGEEDGLTYEEYYGAPFEEAWDRAHVGQDRER